MNTVDTIRQVGIVGKHLILTRINFGEGHFLFALAWKGFQVEREVKSPFDS